MMGRMERDEKQYGSKAAACVLFAGNLQECLFRRTGIDDDILALPSHAMSWDDDPYGHAMAAVMDLAGIDGSCLMEIGDTPLVRVAVIEDADGLACCYYAGIVTEEGLLKIAGCPSDVRRVRVSGGLPDRHAGCVFSGPDDTAYAVASARKLLAARLPGMQAGPDRPDESLKEAVAMARGRLDADFRRGDLFQASLDAADVSKLAYAAFYTNAYGQEGRGGG